MIFYKLYEREWGLLVAACDEELCDKTLKDGDIDFFINPRFYKENKSNAEEFIEILKGASSVNLVGKKSVKCGVSSGLINEKNIMKIAEVPHAQGIVMKI